MLRAVLSISVPALAVTLVLHVVAGAPARLPAQHDLADCRKLEVELPGGARLAGIEDLAVDRARGRLILSAQDRRRSDGGADGLYTLALDRLGDAGSVPAYPLPGTEGLAQFPHGLAFDPASGRLAFVTRPNGSETVPTAVEIGRIGADGAFRSERRVESEALCRANDLDFAGDALWVTLDRRACGLAADDLIPAAATGRVARLDAAGLARPEGSFAFANGVLDTAYGTVVAETRGRALRIHGSAFRMELPGGPDNLNADTADVMLATLHPNTFRLALYMAGLISNAPSRVVAVNLASETVEVLVDDPEGTVFSGATSAVRTGGRVIAGSAYDTGLMICGSAE